MSIPSWGSIALAGAASLAVTALVLNRPISQLLHDHDTDHELRDVLPVNEVAGFTKIGITTDYLVVVNVLPGEVIYTAEEVQQQRPAVGEFSIEGVGTALSYDSRHIEAHIYDRETGKPVVDLEPRIEVLETHKSGALVLNSVKMQDVLVGPSDIHFGDNVVIGGGADLRIRVILGSGQEVVVDGHVG